ncbi:hypothetical protein BGZ65_003671, partial [Modicella reniformis]
MPSRMKPICIINGCKSGRSIHLLVWGPSPESLDQILKRKLEEDPDFALVTKYPAPAPRTAFNHLKNSLQAGIAIDMPYLGTWVRHPRNIQVVKPFSSIVCNRHVLSRPWEGTHAEKMFTLYIADVGVLKTSEEDESAIEVVKRFLALNKDILAIELKMLCACDGAYINAVQ